jgi:hypothetical protein
VISSKPGIPVGTFTNAARELADASRRKATLDLDDDLAGRDFCIFFMVSGRNYPLRRVSGQGFASRETQGFFI